MMTRLAATRLMPREPALVEMRKRRPLGQNREREPGEEGVSKQERETFFLLFKFLPIYR